MKPHVAAAVILVALAAGAPLQAQTPEIDALRARAEQGDVEAQYNLGFRYAIGAGVPQDDAEAARWYRLTAEQGDAEHQQHYPNIPTEVIFENDRVLVQKVVLQPGEWEGIHTHSGNQLYIMLTDGESTVRYGDEETTLVSSAGLVDWQRAVDLSEEHESGNTGDTPLEFLWVNLKQ